MYPAVLEGSFCILHETKYLPLFCFLECRAETKNQNQTKPREGERNTFYCLLMSKNRDILLEQPLVCWLIVFLFLPLFGTYARKMAKGNSDSETLVLRVERKYGRVRNMEVQVGGLRFKRFFF